LQGSCKRGWLLCLLVHEEFGHKNFETHLVFGLLRYDVVVAKGKLEGYRGRGSIGYVPCVSIAIFVVFKEGLIAWHKNEFKISFADVCAVPRCKITQSVDVNR
jgi:hypothetical protein